jgi:hypothetical protein
MSDEEINEAIAAHCGWDFDPEWAREWGSRGRWVEEPEAKQRKFRHAVPRYTHDLNAMHEAEKALTDDQEAQYVTTLCLQVQPTPRLHHATARQRAEAFLRTINKWKE